MGQKRILVTDAQDRPALAAIRSLHAAGHRVSAVGAYGLSPGLWSRWCSSRRVCPEPGPHPAEFVDALAELLRAEPHDVLLPGTDEALYAISTHRDRLEGLVELGLPGHDQVERALDKERLAREAEKAGLAGPEWEHCGRPDDVLAAAARFGYPVLVKGLRTIEYRGQELIRHRSRLVADEAALMAAQRQWGPCIVQRREPGTVLSFCGIATDRGLLATLFARHERIWPSDAGNAAFSVTFEPSAELSRRAGALLAGLGWRGVFQLELIETPDGTIKAIDFNPRLYGSLALSQAAGVPLASLWCAWLLGEDPAPVSATPGIAFRWEDGDARVLLSLLRRGQVTKALAGLVPRRRTTHAYFRAADPPPFLARAAELARDKVRHLRSGRLSVR